MNLNQDDIDKIAEAVIQRLFSDKSELMHWFNTVQKTTDDVLWYKRLEGVAKIDKVELTGPPSRYQPNPTAQGAGNNVIFYSYTFIPRDAEYMQSIPFSFSPTEASILILDPTRIILSRS